jgi:hypothetical protein
MAVRASRGQTVDQNSFLALTRSLTGVPTRRHLLRGLSGLGIGLGVPGLPELAGAKKRSNKKKPKKPKPNSYGCLEVGAPCKNASQCCAGICEGKKGKKRCRAHDTGTCDQRLSGLCSPTPTIAPCNNSGTCFCLRSTANSNVCAQLGQRVCSSCKTDADCEALGLPPGTACFPTSGFLCATDCPETGMACLPPCGVEIPEPEAE